MPRIKKLNMNEVSGVDYPAHLANGFSIIKSANPDKTAAFLKAVGRENAMTTRSTAKSLADATPEEIAEVAKALTPEQLKPIIDAVNSVVEDVGDGGKDDADENSDGSPKSTAPGTPGVDPFKTAKTGDTVNVGGVPHTLVPVAKEDDEPTDPNDPRNLLKAVGGNPKMVELFKAMQTRVEKAVEVANVEKALRLDNEAIQKSREAYGHLGIDHKVVAPAIRKFAEADPKTAEVLTNLLKSLEGQAESASLFKELGTQGGGQETDAYGKLEARAEELVKSEHVSKAVAITKALEENPDLYNAYMKERA